MSIGWQYANVLAQCQWVSTYPDLGRVSNEADQWGQTPLIGPSPSSRLLHNSRPPRRVSFASFPNDGTQ